MLDLIGAVVLTAGLMLNLNALISSLPARRTAQFVLAAVFGAWLGLSAAAASAGVLATGRPFPLIGIFVAFPIVATAVAVALVPRARSALLGVPMPLLIGLNAWRLLGAFFLLLAAEGRLSGPFPYSAGWGDVITGAAAIPLAWLASRDAAQHTRLIAAWNLFGVFDLVVAVALGVTSAAGSPLQIFATGAGSTAVQALPWSLIPTVLVPFYLIVHGTIWAQLRRAGAHPHMTDAVRGMA